MHPPITFFEEKFNLFNSLYFNNEISLAGGIKFNTRRAALGLAYYKQQRIEISTYYVATEKEYLTTLIHEMFHLYAYQKYGCRGHCGKWRELTTAFNLAHHEEFGEIRAYSKGEEKRKGYVISDECVRAYKFVLFTDFEGYDSIVKSNDATRTIALLKRRKCIQPDTTIFLVESELNRICRLPFRRSATWNRLHHLNLSISDITTEPTTKLLKQIK